MACAFAATVLFFTARAEAAPRVVFLDSALADRTVIEGAAVRGTTIVVVEAGDSIVQMTRTLAAISARSGRIDGVHIVSHGGPGELLLGGKHIDQRAIEEAQADLALWRQYLAPGADVSIYGCNLAAGPEGRGLVERLAAATGADVAASVDATGSAARGGNWTLEFATGRIEAGSFFADPRFDGYRGLLATVTLSGTTNVTLTDGVEDVIVFPADGSGVSTLTQGGSWTSDNLTISGVPVIVGFKAGEDFIDLRATNISENSAPAFESDYADSQNAPVIGYDVYYTTYGYGSLDGLQFSISGNTLGAGGGTAGMLVGYTDDTNWWPVMAFFRNTSGTLTAADFLLPGDPDPGPSNVTPSFVGATTSLGVNQNAGATDIRGLLHVSDTDSGQTLTWSQSSAPSHGTLAISSATASSGAADITSGGTITYTPAAGYVGSDSFTVQVSDATASATRTISVTVSDVTAPAVSSVSSSTANGVYRVGDTIAVTIAFAENVTVTGTPTLTLNSGGVATYASGSGTSTLTFNYTVASGDTASDLDYAATNSLALSGGTIRDAAANNATLTLPAVGGGSSLGGQKAIAVDGIAPSLSSTTVPADATYKVNQNLDFTVGFSESVTVTGSPYLSVTLDTGGSVNASYASGTGTTSLVFRYTVALGNLDDNGAAVASSITLNGGAIRDAAGNNAATSGIAFASTAAVLVDGVLPSISSINRLTPIGAMTNVTTLVYRVTFSEWVSGVGVADFSLTATGTASGSIDSLSANTGTTIDVTVVDVLGNGTLRLDLNASGTGIMDAATNGIGSGFTAGQIYTLDTTPPGGPSTPDMTSGTDSGSSSSDDITSNTTPTFTGTAESGSTATLYDTDGTTVLGTATATGGNWSITSSALSSGSHVLTAKARDAAGNTGSASSGLTVTIDAAAPTGLGLSATTVVTSNATSTSTIATLSSTDGLVVTYGLATGNGTNDADNSRVTISGTSLKVGGSSLIAGTYHIYLSATDAAGNTASQAFTITAVDAPSVSSIVRAGGASAAVPASATSIEYTITFSESVTGVDAGDFALTATGTAAGIVASVSGSGTTYLVTVATLSGDGTLRLDLIGSGTGIRNAGSTDIAAGFTAGQTYTLDHTNPSAPSTPDMTSGTDTGSSSSDNITSNTTPTFAGTAESGSTVKILDTDGTTMLGTATATGGNWSITTSALTSGSHTITAKSTDGSGNTSSASSGLSVTIDTTAPAVPVITAITDDTGAGTEDQITTDTTLVLSGTAEADATVTVYRNAAQIGTAVADGDGAWSFDYTGTSLAEGTHTFTATATDAAGNVGAESPAFVVEIDISTPAAPVIEAFSSDTGSNVSDGVTRDNTLVLSGTADAGAEITVSLSGVGLIGTSAPDGTGVWVFDHRGTALADGAHIFNAFASDPAGNASSVSADFAVTIDTTAPTIAVQPTGATFEATGAFDLTVAATDEHALSFQWYLDGTPLTDDAKRAGSTAATLSHTDIEVAGFAGDYTVVVTDAAGNATTSAIARVVVEKAGQTITFPAIADQLTTSDPFAIDAAASTGLPVTFAVVSGPAELSGGTVTIIGAGTVVIRATLAGNANYNAATADRTFEVSKAQASVVLAGLDQSYDGTSRSATAITSPASLAVDFTYDGGATAPIDAGTYAVVATIDDEIYQGTASGSLVVSKAAASVTLSGLFQTYDGAAKAASATTSPAGLVVDITYDGSAAAPVNAGSYTVVANVVDRNYQGVDTDTLDVAKAGQAITFAPPASVTVGAPVALIATAGSGLPVTFALVSGNASLAGTMLTAHEAGPITLRASQAGNGNYHSASAELTIAGSDIAKLPQTIAFTQPADHGTGDAAFALQATAGSGLPVSFSLVSGPAEISGDLVTLTGAPGRVTIVATQAGNAIYAAAPSVTRSFAVNAPRPPTFFGSVSDGSDVRGDFAAYLATDGSSGSLIGYLPGFAAGFVVHFTLDPSGAFVATITPIRRDAAPAAARLAALGGSVAATVESDTWTFHGRLEGGMFVGTIDELGLDFSAPADPAEGPAAPLAGFFTSESLDTTDGAIYSIIGTTGDVYVLGVLPDLVDGGTGAIVDDSGEFLVTTPSGNGISGAVEGASSTIEGSVVRADGGETDFAGVERGVPRTDRLVNLSSRGAVGSGDEVLIMGFVVGGDAPRPLLLRAVGPGLEGFGVRTRLLDPRLHLFRDGVQIYENDDWGAAANLDELRQAMARIGAFELPDGSTDAALLVMLAPGAYTAVVEDASGRGVALAEIYDASENLPADYERLLNISTRGFVGTGDDVLIGGFVVNGNAPKRVLIRGVGPSLSRFGVGGVLADPELTVFDGGVPVAANTDWGQGNNSAGELATAATATNAFALDAGSKDAALLVTLAPGAYTVHLAGAGGTSGVGLIEIYEVP